MNENATVINEICSTFPFSLAEGKCKSWLHSYVDKYTSQEVCHDMGFCSQTEGVAVESEPALDVCADCKEVTIRYYKYNSTSAHTRIFLLNFRVFF